MNSEPNIKPAIPPIKLATSNAREQISTVLKVMDELETRLTPIMRNQPPQIATPPDEVDPGSSEYFDTLIEINRLLDVITNRLYNLLGRLEI